MSTLRLQFTTSLVDDHYELTAEVISSPVSKDVFLFFNTGTDTLGEFVGVVDVDQLTQYPKWTGTPVPVFAVKFVRNHIATQSVSTSAEAEQWRTILEASVLSFLRELSTIETEVLTVDVTV